MTKVLVLITTKFVPYGGLTSVMMNYYRAMDRKDLQIDFASTNTVPLDLAKELERNASRYFCLGRRQRVFRYFWHLRKLLKKEQYDVIHIHGNSATTVLELLPAQLRKVPKRIIQIHNSTCTHKRLNSILMPLFRRLYTDAVACSQQAGEWIFSGPFVVLPNAIDLKRYAYNGQEREDLRGEFSTAYNIKVIGNVGKMESEQKNHRFILMCFAELTKISDQYRLWLVGDGENRREFEKLAEELGVGEKVLFLGMRQDVPALLSAMDYFLFPSLWEGLPLSVIEAQSAGLSCLLSENITEEVNVTPLVDRLDLENGPTVWAKQISTMEFTDRSATSAAACLRLEEAGFDITKSCALLRELYLG